MIPAGARKDFGSNKLISYTSLNFRIECENARKINRCINKGFT